MYAPAATTGLSPLMTELIELLGEIPMEPGKPRAKALRDRLDALEDVALALGAPAETLAAIQGARVLMDLAELPPLPQGGPSTRTIQ
jgi:hypothetical protein